MTKLFPRLPFSLLSVVFVHTLAIADVTTKPCGSDNPPSCVDGLVEGEIKSEDAVETSKVIESVERLGRGIFYIDSAGGDVKTAILIGRQLRKARALVIVGKGAQCLSACVFLLAGAVERFPIGRVGIHRPYIAALAKRTYDDTQRSFRDIENYARQFLIDMNLPGTLFDAMMRVPPQRIRDLSTRELYDFGLASTDPIEQELRDTTKARRLGISRQELLKRKGSAERLCAKYLSMPWSEEENYFTCTEGALRARQ